MQKEFLTPKRIKYVIISFIVLCMAIVLYVVIVNISHIGKVAVEIKYAPFEAAVFIDNQNYPTNNAINWLEPGAHHVMVVMNGFRTLEADVVITEDTKYLYGSLETLDPDNLELYQKYQNDYYEVEGVAGEESTKDAEELVEQHPILNYLPYIKNNYAIGTLFDEQNDLIVTIRAEEAQLDQAINKLRSFEGITLSEQNIRINDFNNVLEGKFVNNDNSDPTIFIENGYRNLGTPLQVNNGQQVNDYYYTTISVGKYAGYIPVTYRIILQKSANSWRLVGTPYPLLTTYNTPGVDAFILDAANQLDAPTAVLPDSFGDGH